MGKSVAKKKSRARLSSRPHFSKNEMISWPHGIQGPQRADLDLCTTLIGSRTAGISI